MKRLIFVLLAILLSAFPVYGQMSGGVMGRGGDANAILGRPIPALSVGYFYWNGTTFEWSASTAGAFTSLTDVPASYTGQANKYLVVNPGETALTFTASTAPAQAALLDSTQHSDSTTGTATRGDLIYVPSTLKWTRLPKSSSGSFLMSGTNDIGWSAWLMFGTAAQTYTFPTTTASIARTDAGQIFIGVQAFTAPTVATSITPNTAANASLGTGLLPFSSVFIGDAATNNIQIINTDASAARVATFPDVTGTVVVATASATATKALFASATSGAPEYRVIATGDLPAVITGLTSVAATTFTGAFTGALTGNADTATLATAASTSTIVNATTAATMYPVWVTANTGNLPLKTTSAALSFRPDTGILTATGFAGPINGIVGGTTPAAGTFTTLAAVSANSLTLGHTSAESSPAIGSIIVKNATNAFTVTIQSGTTTPGSYTLTLPVAVGGTNYLLNSGTAGAMGWTDPDTFSIKAGSSSIVTVGALTAGSLASGFTPVTVPLGGTGASTFALNGVLYGNAANAIGVTAIGGEGQLLRVGASPYVPAWSTLTMPATIADGSVFVANAENILSAVTWHAAGTKVLTNVDGTIGWADATAPGAHDLVSVTHTLAGGTAGKIVRTIDATSFGWSTSTFDDTYDVSTILYASSANLVAGLATANGGVLNTGATGIPSITPTPLLGKAGTTAGTLAFSGVTSGTITLTPTAVAGTNIITLPAATGTITVGPTTTTAGVVWIGTAAAGVGAWSTGVLALGTNLTTTTGTVTLVGNAANTSSLTLPAGSNTLGSAAFTATTAYAPAAGSADIVSVGTIGTGVWSGTAIAANKGGTGQTVYVIGDLLYASSTTALSRLADVAVGNVLLSGGVGVIPGWGKVADSHVSFTAPVLGAATATSINALTLTAQTVGFTITGGTTPHTLTVTTSGTLGSAAYTATSAYQAADTEVAAIAGLTFADASIIQLTGAGTAAVLTSVGNNYFLTSTSDNLALEFKTPANALTAIGGAPAAGSASILTVGALAAGSLAVGFTPVTVPLGGTGLATIALGSVLVANTADVLTALTSTSGTYFLKNLDGVISWGTPSGEGGVQAVGDCADGLCGDGTSDGGTYIELYNAAGNTRIVNTAGVLEAKTAAGAAYAAFKALSITTDPLEGSNKLGLTSNDSLTPSGTENILFAEDDIMKFAQSGSATEYSLVGGLSATQVFFASGVTSGAVLYGSAANTISTSAALTQYGVVVGGGAGAAPYTLAAGINNQVLRGSTGAAPAFGSLAVADLPVVTASKGGTGIANNDLSTITISGNYGLTLTLGAATALTLPVALTIPAVVAGDLLYGSNTAVLSALTKGTAYHTLRMNSGATAPEWALVGLTNGVTGVLPIANGGTNKSITLAAGGVIWSDADSFEVTAAGSAGQLFVSTGTTAPAWSTSVLTESSNTWTLTNGSAIVTALAGTNTFGALTSSGFSGPLNGIVGASNPAAGTFTSLAGTLVNAAGAGADVLTLSGTLGIMDGTGSDIFRGIYLNYTNVNHTGGSFYGMHVNLITGDADATELGLYIGTGWDYGIFSDSDIYARKGTTGGSLFLAEGTGGGAHHFQIKAPDSLDASLIWTLPTAAPGGTNYLLNADADGTMGYTDPSAFALKDGSNFIGTAYKLAAYTATNTLTELVAVGATGTILRGATGAIPAWSTSTFADTYAIGTLLHASAANVVTGLAAGTTGQVLTGATGAAPAWSSSISVATLDMSLSTSSIPWLVNADTGADGTEGAAHWESDTDMLTIGAGGATTVKLNFTADAVYTFPTATKTIAATTDISDHAALITGVHGLVFTAEKTLTLTESLTLNALPIGGLAVATGANTLGPLAVGLTTEILVGGGAGTVPVWTTATGTGDPVRADSPTLVDDVTIGAAGVKLTGSNGSLTILGLGTGADEDLKIDLDTTADTVIVTSPASSATTIQTPMAIRSSGIVTGLMPSVIVLVASGVHDGGADQAIMTDAGIDIGANALVGMTVYNVTDVSSCTITANAATTITCTLAGGTDNNWDDGDVWQVGPGPYQSGSWFYVTAAGTIRHPATAGYVSCYESDAAAVVTVEMASDSMIFQGTLDAAVVALDAGDSIDSSGSTTGDFMCIHNKSATEAQGKGKRGTWVDGGAT